MKLNPNVYRKAAERIARGQNSYCCTAINGVTPNDSRHLEPFKLLFDPSEEGGTGFFWAECPAQSDDNKRIFALLLMAEIVERENKDTLITILLANG